ncbi:class I SAM-dependent methyltransferase [Escherichia coli]
MWKRFTIDCSGVRRGQTVLDLAGGTGDLTAKFSCLVGETGKVVLADINESMLKWDARSGVISVRWQRFVCSGER